MVADGILQRVARGLYVNPAASSKNRWIAEEIAKALRPGSLSYVSLESILSEYGVISQIPVARMTVMTTGASGIVETPYGTIEFTHTKRGKAEIVKRTLVVKGRPMRIATKRAAIRDLLRVARNVNMMDPNELEDEPDEETASSPLQGAGQRACRPLRRAQSDRPRHRTRHLRQELTFARALGRQV